MPDLGTIASILQIITFVAFLGAAYKWGRAVIEKHPVGYWLLIVLLVLTAGVSALSFASIQGWLPKQKPIQVFSKMFKNEDVVLDDHEYYDCTFEHVHYKYGGGYFKIERPTIIGGEMQLTGTTIAVSNTLRVLDMVGLLNTSKIKSFKAGPPP